MADIEWISAPRAVSENANYSREYLAPRWVSFVACRCHQPIGDMQQSRAQVDYGHNPTASRNSTRGQELGSGRVPGLVFTVVSLRPGRA